MTTKATTKMPKGGGDAPTSTAFSSAKDAALRFLTYRARSEAEVRRRLSTKYAPATVEAVVESLLRQNLLNDLGFAREWRASRERFRPRAACLVRQELLRKGVSPEVIQESLQEFDDEANAARAAAGLARRLAAREVTQREFQGKVAAHLQRRGFGGGLVRSTVERLWEELGTDSLHCQGDANDDQR